MSATTAESDIHGEFQNPDQYHPFDTRAERIRGLIRRFSGEQQRLLMEAHSRLAPLVGESWTSLRPTADHAARLLGHGSRSPAGERLLASLLDRLDGTISRLETAVENRRFVRPYVKSVHRAARQAYTVLVAL